MDHRPRRRSQIQELLRSERVESQEHLQELLQARGVIVAQATLSRDLRALGVVKGPSGYFLPDDLRLVGAAGHAGGASRVRLNGDVHSTLERSLQMYVQKVDVGGNLIVLRTGPGHAQIVGLEIDRAPLDGVMGTIAGDDTIFIAVRSERRAHHLARELRHAAGLDARPLAGVGA